jgi:hypothetical protein
VYKRSENGVMNEHDKNPSILTLQARTSAAELARLNRVTGLTFDVIPTALIGKKGGLELAQDDGEELIYRALYLWNE